MVNINFEAFMSDNRLYEYMILKKEWDGILNSVVEHLYDKKVLPSEKGMIRLAAFAEMAEVNRMYLCGAFSPEQFQEITQLEEEVYCERDTMLRQECKSQKEYEEKSEGMETISFKDLQAQIHHPVFLDISMDFYVAAMNKMAWAAGLCDICGPNFCKYYIDLDEPQQSYNVYREGNIFESDAGAVDFLIGIRNGCTVRNERLDFTLFFLSNRLYGQAIKALQTLPETSMTKGAYMRGIFASSYFLKIYDPKHVEIAEPTELLIHEAINLSKQCVKSTYEDDEEWGKYQCDYIDKVMNEYYTYRIVDKLKEKQSLGGQEAETMGLENGNEGHNPRKITSQSSDRLEDDRAKQMGE